MLTYRSRAMPTGSLGATYLLGRCSTDVMRITRGLASAPNGCIAGGPLETVLLDCPRARAIKLTGSRPAFRAARVALDAWVRCPACVPRRLQPCFANSCNEDATLGAEARRRCHSHAVPPGLVDNGCPEAYGLPIAIFHQLSRVLLDSRLISMQSLS